MVLTDRIPYPPLIDRPKLKLPGGKKPAVCVILNVEEWRIENAIPRVVLSPPMGQPLLPDVPNWSCLEAPLDYVIGHDGVALMTASEIGDWYRTEMATGSAR